MAIAPIETTGPTITVSTSEELHAAYDTLSYTSGGGTILLEPGSYGGFSRYPYGVDYEENPVILRSADADDPAHFTGINLRDISNVSIENVHVDSTENGVGDGSLDLQLKNCSNIQITNSLFTQDPDSVLKDAGEIMDGMSYIRDSQDIVFSNNVVNGYLFALQATEIQNMEVIGNEFTNIQGDGFRGGGFQDLVIEDNYFHDFYPVSQSITHADMIQIWGANSSTLTQNVTISSNILIATDAATQSIFIRNEEFGKDGDPTGTHYTDITITDNLIYNAHKWGIHLDNVDGALIDGNTVLYNPDAQMDVSGTDYSYMPEIFARNSLDITATNNISGAVTVPDGSVSQDNQIVTFSDPTEPSYYGNHFVNPSAGEAITLADLNMLVTSPYYGVYGSSIGNSPDEISEGVLGVISASANDADSYEVLFDARVSQVDGKAIGDDPAYSFSWTFSDGSVDEGATVQHNFSGGGFEPVSLEIRHEGEVVSQITRNFAIETKDIFTFDFEGGVLDISEGVPDVLNSGKTLSDGTDTAFLIGDDNKLEITRHTEEIHELDTFGLALDLLPTGDEPSGVFLELYGVMQGSIDDEGGVSFKLTTDSGEYSLKSDDTIFADGGMHRIGIAFNGETGQLQMFADGESVASTEAWGTTAPEKYFGLIFGNTFKDSMDAIIDNVEMSVDPSVAGQLPEVDLPSQEEPASAPQVPPIVEEEPVAEAEEPVVEAEEPVVEAEEPVVEAEEPPVLEVDEQPILEVVDPEIVDEPTDTEEPAIADESEDDDKGGGSIISKLIQAFLSIFGLGKKDDDGESNDDDVEVATSASMQLLTDILPATGAHDDALPDDDEEDEGSFLDAA